MVALTFSLSYVFFAVVNAASVQETRVRRQIGCVTISGQKVGLPCQLPFVYNGVARNGCIIDQDPEQKPWCSTRTNGGVHVQGNWGHCGNGCPTEASEIVVDADVDEPGFSFDYEDTEEPPCNTASGKTGTCRQPSLCVGVTLRYIENNECNLAGDDVGVCCVGITENNIVDISDRAEENLENLPRIDINEVKSIVREENVVEIRFDQPASSEADEESIPNNANNFVDDTSPSEFHLRFNTPRKEIIGLDGDARVFLETTKRLKDNNNLTNHQTDVGLRADFNSDTVNEIDERCPWTPAPSCRSGQKYRSFDGSCNNLRNSNLGRTGTPFQRILLPEYANGTLDVPRKRTGDGMELPSARHISNTLTEKTNPVDTDNTVMVMQMGQFVDHDLTHTPNHGIQCCGTNGAFPRSFDADKCFPIRISNSDPFWKGKKTCMNFARSLISPDLKCGLQSREQLNQITHWIDGSNIYGSTDESAQYLRGSRGKLKISEQAGTKWGSLPSCAAEPTGKVTACDVCGGRKKDCFFSGDFRVNEQLNLIVLHTLFMREHNRIATALAKLNPRWSDEKIYQEARKINVAEYQHIVFKEWLPTIIGTNFMRVYGLWPLSSGHSFDYANNFDPRINNEFSAAAFRFGHSMIPKTLKAIMRSGRDQSTTSSTILDMREVFFQPKELARPGFLDGMVRGMSGQGSQAWDSSFVDDIRNHLFESSPGKGGLDLVALNIQRGRDHGLPGYNNYLKICTGKAAEQWSDLRKTMEPVHVEQLRRVYKSINDIDLYVGGFLEQPHQDSILGPVFKCIIGDQFARLKKGDRFFYDLGNDPNIRFSEEQLDEVRKTSMARIICDNTDHVDRIQPLAFKLANSKANAVKLCTEKAIPKMNLVVFRESGRSNGR
jgi:peroxidase